MAVVDGHLDGVAVVFGHGAHQSIVFTNKVGDEGILGFFVQHVRRGALLNDAVVEHRDAVGQRQGFTLVVGDVDHRDAEILVNGLDFILHLFAQILVKGAQGLVHQHQIGVKDEGPRHRHALLLAAGELRRPPFAELPQLHHIQGTLDPLRLFRLAHPPHVQGKGEILGNGQVGEQRIVLEHHADAAFVRRHPINRLIRQINLTVGGRFETRQHHQTRRFTGS